MAKFSVVILTKNEETNILDCLETLDNIDEVVIIDDYSTDRTLDAVKSLKRKNIKIFQHALDSDFSKQRNFGFSKIKNDWAFFVDADERVSKDLTSEIREVIEGNQYSGFKVKRSDVMWGKKLKYGETGNIKLARLGLKGKGEWLNTVHEYWDIKGQIGVLKSELIHYPHQTVQDFLSEINLYTTLRADELFKKNAQVTLLAIICYPAGKFLQNYFLKLGFMDGIPGFIVAVMMSFHSFLVRSKLWLLNQKPTK